MPIEPTAEVWGALMSACKMHKNLDLGAYAAEKAIELDPVDSGPHVILSNIYASAGRWGDVTRVRKVMKCSGVKKEPGCSWVEIENRVHMFVANDDAHPQKEEIRTTWEDIHSKIKATGYVPDTSSVLFFANEQERELSRPDANGVMSTVTTMQAINEKIVSLNYEEYTVEIKTADAQESHEKGVIILVPGCLTGKDHTRKKFIQTFFLAPQDKGYFVLNDVFRYVGESEPVVVSAATTVDPPEAEDVVQAELIHVSDQVAVQPAASFEEEDLTNGAKVCDPSDYEESAVDDATIEPVHPATEPSPDVEEDAPKKSYASIGLKPWHPIHVPSNKEISGQIDITQQYVHSTSPKSEDPAAAKPGALGAPNPASDSSPESSRINEEVEGYSIHIRSLPINATVELLEEVFQRFGSIRPNGIQVRNAKASPVIIGDRSAVIEEKRTTTKGKPLVTSSSRGRGRYPPSRGVFRSDSFRGRGNYGVGGQGYGWAGASTEVRATFLAVLGVVVTGVALKVIN
ncbi:hypothetical protein MLD38_028040 [Melastoma candidum]|uniref:Uncharacterized protein n=1 Tax=Melastoma candidum TaxID=119954 RepID=A0ACB9MZP9_9MYRT|nr:hypothetical protein MLD38_028040 [Melastoma candidum]